MSDLDVAQDVDAEVLEDIQRRLAEEVAQPLAESEDGRDSIVQVVLSYKLTKR